MPLLFALFLQVTTQSLVDEMNDLDRLTRSADYVTRQFSSFDRASRDGKDWFANNDRGQYLRKEGDEFVMAETEGPGAIVRIWSANPAGRLRIYLDGAIALEEDFGALLSGKVESFPSPYAGIRAKGGNLYFPFPYAKGMKVTCTKGDLYYHVNYRTYPKETKVETFSRDRVPPSPKFDPASSGENTTAKEIQGPGVLRRLEIPLPEDPAELRRKMLRITVDGELSVCTPLGDFFGTAPGRTPYESVALGIRTDGTGWCAFPMPFEKSLKIDVDAPVLLSVTKESRPLRFHAWWRGTNAVATRPMSDWPVLHATGAGRLVGCFLAIRSSSQLWWGEGDEHIYLDGENFPSTFGTGTEDYFGYAWGSTELFQAPYHNQTRVDGPANFGQTAVARYHILDDIPFQKSIRFDMEIWHWKECTVGYSTVAYWYATPGSKHEFTEPDPKDLEIIPIQLRMVAGAIEAEAMGILETTGGKASGHITHRIQDMSGEGWLHWGETIPGDKLRVRFDSPAEGKKMVAFAFAQGPEFGQVKLSVNGSVVSESIDLYAETLGRRDEQIVEGVLLKSGANELAVEMIGSSDKVTSPKIRFALDYLRILD